MDTRLNIILARAETLSRAGVLGQDGEGRALAEAEDEEEEVQPFAGTSRSLSVEQAVAIDQDGSMASTDTAGVSQVSGGPRNPIEVEPSDVDDEVRAPMATGMSECLLPNEAEADPRNGLAVLVFRNIKAMTFAVEAVGLLTDKIGDHEYLKKFKERMAGFMQDMMDASESLTRQMIFSREHEASVDEVEKIYMESRSAREWAVTGQNEWDEKLRSMMPDDDLVTTTAAVNVLDKPEDILDDLDNSLFFVSTDRLPTEIKRRRLRSKTEATNAYVPEPEPVPVPHARGRKRTRGAAKAKVQPVAMPSSDDDAMLSELVFINAPNLD